MKRVLGLALYGPLAASTRYRMAQYVPGLADHRIELDIRHLLGDAYLQRTFQGKRASVVDLLHSGWRRLLDLFDQGDYDALMVHCELFPLMPSWVERVLLRRPYIYDFDDAFYLKYRRGRLGRLKPILGNKFDSMIQRASAVTAGNELLATYAKQLNSNVHLLPTVVDTDRYRVATHERGKEFVVGWIGSPSTSRYLDSLIEPLARLGEESPVRFVVIGGDAPTIPNVQVDALPWQEDTEIDAINKFDVGVMPLPDDEWARGKCAFKLIQYMACGVPVIASPVGANVDVVGPTCGLLATTGDEWLAALRRLRDDASLGAQMGQAGRQRIVDSYSLHENLPVLAGIIARVG